jgi:hypothetical protein
MATTSVAAVAAIGEAASAAAFPGNYPGRKVTKPADVSVAARPAAVPAAAAGGVGRGGGLPTATMRENEALAGMVTRRPRAGRHGDHYMIQPLVARACVLVPAVTSLPPQVATVERMAALPAARAADAAEPAAGPGGWMVPGSLSMAVSNETVSEHLIICAFSYNPPYKPPYK